MRPALLLLAAAPLFAQVAARPTATAANMPPGSAAVTTSLPKTGSRIPLSAFVNIERTFDAKVSAMASDNLGPVDLLGATRGVYLDGFGVVFTTEMGLIQTPTINPFNTTITQAQKDRVQAAKIKRLPALKNAIVETLRVIAASLTQVPEDQQVVLAVRLDYSSWEKTAGLPGLITARADRRSAQAGNILVQEQ
jgi:hypothetical protein